MVKIQTQQDAQTFKAKCYYMRTDCYKPSCFYPRTCPEVVKYRAKNGLIQRGQYKGKTEISAKLDIEIVRAKLPVVSIAGFEE